MKSEPRPFRHRAVAAPGCLIDDKSSSTEAVLKRIFCNLYVDNKQLCVAKLGEVDGLNVGWLYGKKFYEGRYRSVVACRIGTHETVTTETL